MLSVQQKKSYQKEIFNALKNNNSERCIKFINKLTIIQLDQLAVREAPIAVATMKFMNIAVFQKLVQIGDSFHFGFQDSIAVFLSNIHNDKIGKYLEIREDIFDIFLQMDGIRYEDFFHHCFLGPLDDYKISWILRICKKYPDYYKEIDDQNCDISISIKTLDHILYRCLVSLREEYNLSIENRGKTIASYLQDHRHFKNCAGHITCTFERFFEGYYDKTNLPPLFHEMMAVYNAKHPYCKEIHKSVCYNNRSFFDYFFQNGVHLVKHTVNLLDTVVAYQLDKLLADKNLFRIESNIVQRIVGDYDIYFANINEEVVLAGTANPELEIIMNDMIFSTDFVYYIVRLLDSPVPKKMSKFTKIMLKDFIIPVSGPVSTLQALSLAPIIDTMDNHCTGHPKKNTIMDIKNSHKRHYCLHCNKIYIKSIYEMKGEIMTYNRTNIYQYDGDNNKMVILQKTCNYLPTSIYWIDKFSFCSQKCQDDFYDF